MDAAYSAVQHDQTVYAKTAALRLLIAAVAWRRGTNLWRERTNLRPRSERLTGVGPAVVAHRMLRSSLAQSWQLPAWPSTPRCIGDIGNENLRQPHFDDGNLYRHFLGIHGAATGIGHGCHARRQR